MAIIGVSKFKVHFCGGEGINWALDHDLRQMQQLTSNFAKAVELDEADIVHSVWWRGLLHIPKKNLEGKRVIASVANDPRHLVTQADYIRADLKIDAWLCEFKEAMNFMSRMNKSCFLLPDPVEMDVFFPPNDRKKTIQNFKENNGIPKHTYLIGNFNRDTDGADFSIPKRQKGADLLLEILVHVKDIGIPVHVLLAGPRRHWIRKGLREAGIPYTYIGEEMEDDDLRVNTLGLKDVANLMRSIDLLLVTSRWEGAPNALHEASSSMTKIISPPAGQVPDVLSAQQIYYDIHGAVQLIERDYKDDILNKYLCAAYEVMVRNHGYTNISKQVYYIYEMVSKMKPKNEKNTQKKWWHGIFNTSHKSVNNCQPKDDKQLWCLSESDEDKDIFGINYLSKQGYNLYDEIVQDTPGVVFGTELLDRVDKDFVSYNIIHILPKISEYNNVEWSRLIEWNTKHVTITVFINGDDLLFASDRGFRPRYSLIIRPSDKNGGHRGLIKNEASFAESEIRERFGAQRIRSLSQGCPLILEEGENPVEQPGFACILKSVNNKERYRNSLQKLIWLPTEKETGNQLRDALILSKELNSH
ncbi:MAG: hypothetical protein AAGA64_00320 [Bacteroidota bacterium]